MSVRDWLEGETGAEQGDDGSSARVFEQRSTKVWINGEELSADELRDRGLLEEVARQLGTTPEKLVEELQGTGMREISPDTAEATLAGGGPAARAQCPGCEHTVLDRNGLCMYCGSSL
jgi:hypothetical protein